MPEHQGRGRHSEPRQRRTHDFTTVLMPHGRIVDPQGGIADRMRRGLAECTDGMRPPLYRDATRGPSPWRRTWSRESES